VLSTPEKAAVEEPLWKLPPPWPPPRALAAPLAVMIVAPMARAVAKRVKVGRVMVLLLKFAAGPSGASMRTGVKAHDPEFCE
jgi:hypothetical protein